MGAKRTTRSSKTKPSARPQAQPSRLQNLAARPSNFGDDVEDESMLVDNSGVFRVTAAIAQAQTGHDEDDDTMFPNASGVMAAQRDGFRQDGTTITDVVEENAVLDAASQAEKKQRLATLVARSRMHKRR